jgi:uncharacterized protein (TIGR03089 family)
MPVSVNGPSLERAEHRQRGSVTIAGVSDVFNRQLQARTARSGGTPLLTYYDERTGERTELSGVSFANWVDKTANLLLDELLVEPGQQVRLRLGSSAPAHWVTLVWVGAIWRAGCSVTLQPEEPAAVEVVGPEDAAAELTGIDRVACSLHPLGLGFSTPLPAGVIDYGIEVRAQPDSCTAPFPGPGALAWSDDVRELTQADVVAGTEPGRPRRTMIAPEPVAEFWPVVRQALVEPVITGGSAVIVVEADATRRAAIARSERVDPVG